MALSQFGQALHSRIQAGFQAMSASTGEPGRVLQELRNYGRETGTGVLLWSILGGGQLTILHPGDGDGDGPLAERVARAIGRFDAAPTAAELMAKQAADDAFADLLVVYVDAHTEFEADSTLRTLFTSLFAREGFSGSPCLFLHPNDGLHADVAGLIDPIRLKPMEPEAINAIAVEHMRESLAAQGRDPGIPADPADPLRTKIAAACAGLPHHRIVDALALACDREGPAYTRESLKRIRSYRTNIINDSGLLRVHEGAETFADVGGLADLKAFLASILRPRTGPVRAMPKGVMLHGVPGAGKSLIAKALGNETDRITLELNIGALLGGIVGQTESNIRRALDIVDASGPAIVFLDEIEKAMAGSGSGGQTDSGVMARVLDILLRWLNDHESPAFLIATTNNVAALPTEFTRAERFDAIYFVDTPLASSRNLIWRMYVDRYGLDPTQPLPDDHDWTGAEIATACRLARLRDLPIVEAARSVVPVAKLNRDQLAALRQWSKNHGALDADLGGPYSPDARGGVGAVVRTRRRKLSGDPENN